MLRNVENATLQYRGKNYNICFVALRWTRAVNAVTDDADVSTKLTEFFVFIFVFVVESDFVLSIVFWIFH